MDVSLIFTLFEGLPRQGPGNRASTEKALAMIPRPPKARILDIGCGCGMQTLDLAEACPDCTITATDIYQPYLDELMKRAGKRGVGGRITTVRASMDDLPFVPASFDIVWAEGSAFVMGFEAALRSWRQFVVPGGHVALSEMAWFSAEPSPEARDYFARVYPDIKTEAEQEAVIRAAGYAVVGSFRLPREAWTAAYYDPFSQRIPELRERYGANPDMQALIDEMETEIDMYSRHSAEYGYTFWILRT